MRRLISNSSSRHREAEEFDGARSRRNEAGEHPDGGGLAGAIGAEEPEEGAARDREGEPIDSGPAVVDLAQIADGDGGCGRGHEVLW